mmetsp:Transcript_1285/g.5483  ORF Transcript_1285/g.5483 Transcript_1285/m.5483 type:complete len:208 (-) Transcript_1285:678-1301(-)
MPDQAARTSERATGASKYFWHSCRMKLVSFSVGFGLIVSSVTLSVVPLRVPFSHGKKKSTRPSEVFGTIRPMLSGLKCSGSMMCTPPAGTMRSTASSSAIFRTLHNAMHRDATRCSTMGTSDHQHATRCARCAAHLSAKHPVALMICLALIVKVSAVCRSCTTAPLSLPSSDLVNSSTRTRFATAAPLCAAVRAMVSDIRVSFIWPS